MSDVPIYEYEDVCNERDEALAEVKLLRRLAEANKRAEYGVRRAGGHIEPRISRHVAACEVQERIEAGEPGVWLVVRYVTDWETP